MSRLGKLLLILSMVAVWGWTLFMGLFATHPKGRIVSWCIGLLLNSALAVYYSYRLKRPRSFREWLSM